MKTLKDIKVKSGSRIGMESAPRLKHVRFLDEAYKKAKTTDSEKIKIDYFMYIIEKYFNKETNCVVLETDKEKLKFDHQLQVEKDELNKIEDELDEMFFSSDEETKTKP